MSKPVESLSAADLAIAQAALGIPPALSGFGRRKRQLINNTRLAQFVSTPGSGNAITAAADSANGGWHSSHDLISMTLTTGNTANKNSLVALPAKPTFPTYGNGVPFYVTGEFKVPLATYLEITLDDGAGNNIIYLRVGLSNNTVYVTPTGGSALTPAPTNFNQSQDFRLTFVVVPTGLTTGDVSVFLHYSDSVSSQEVQAFLGKVSYSTAAVPRQVTIKNGALSQTGSATVARLRAYELLGVMVGCSLEAGYAGWAPDPNRGRNFSPNSYNEDRNPAMNLSQLLNGDDDLLLNHACGGFTVDQMSAGFTDWCLSLAPQLVVVGQATNSLVGVIANFAAGSARAAEMARLKSLYLAMVQAALTQGAVVLALGITPRSDTAITNFGTVAEFKALALDWNAWMQSVIKPLGARVCDAFSLLEDPGAPGAMLAAYDAGDKVHFTWKAQRLLAERQYRALMGG